jgi:hypothetical protein
MGNPLAWHLMAVPGQFGNSAIPDAAARTTGKWLEISRSSGASIKSAFLGVHKRWSD